ncbi:MAG: phosphoadenosine phosphosulfate reductase family protein [Pseudomonadota bacterium]
MLHLAMKAFHPAKPPFPLLHVDTTWKFREMIAFSRCDGEAARPRAAGAYQPGGAWRAASDPSRMARAVHTDVMKTQALRPGARQIRFRCRLRWRASR